MSSDDVYDTAGDAARRRPSGRDDNYTEGSDGVNPRRMAAVDTDGGPRPSTGNSSRRQRRSSGNERRASGSADDGTQDIEIHVTRPAYSVSQLRKDMSYQPKTKRGVVSSTKEYLMSCCQCSASRMWSLLLLRLPVLAWLPRYSFRRNLTGDVIAGCTVAIMHLPQGMAYAILAGVPPIHGLYTAFFPVLVYAMLGTSRHISIGTFAVTCLMTGKIVGELSTPTGEGVISKMFYSEHINETYIPSSVLEQSAESVGLLRSQNLSVDESIVAGLQRKDFSPIEVAAAVTLMVGLWQVVFGLLQLGHVCVFLSDMLISGFTTGAAFHVLSSQVTHILGINVQRYNGPFRLVYTYIDVFKLVPTANLAAVVMSAVCIPILVFNNELIKPRLKKLTNIPMPIEMIAVVMGTAVAYFSNLEDKYQLNVVGDIPTGLPSPKLPQSQLLTSVLVDGLVIAVVSYVISFSMAKLFSIKHDYQVDATQELYAGGVGNIVGSMFLSLPAAASMSRSLIQEGVGGKTQVSSLVTCGGILIIIYVAGPLFRTLPNCILASIIIVALKGMLLQVYDFLKMWKQSRVDSLQWLVTFLVTVLVDIDYGLGAGVVMSVLLLLMRNNSPAVKQLGWVRNTNIYVDIKKYKSAVLLPGGRLCRVAGSLHFANCDTFKKKLASATGLDLTQLVAARKSRMKQQDKTNSLPSENNNETNNNTEDQAYHQQVITEVSLNNPNSTDSIQGPSTAGHRVDEGDESRGGTYMTKESQPAEDCNGSPKGFDNPAFDSPDATQQDPLKLLLCMSGVGWIDVYAATHLAALYSGYRDVGVTMALAAPNDSIMQVVSKCDAFSGIPDNMFFLTLHDAVTFHLPHAVQETRTSSTGTTDSSESSSTSGYLIEGSKSASDEPHDDDGRIKYETKF